MNTQAFETVTKDSHPAESYVYAFLESLKKKNEQDFAESCGMHVKIDFFANLPGGVQVTSIQKLIDMHNFFLKVPILDLSMAP